MDNEPTSKLHSEIMNLIPCYRDVFGLSCEFTCGCDLCPDHFNVVCDIVNKVENVIDSYTASVKASS